MVVYFGVFGLDVLFILCVVYVFVGMCFCVCMYGGVFVCVCIELIRWSRMYYFFMIEMGYLEVCVGY